MIVLIYFKQHLVHLTTALQFKILPCCCFVIFVYFIALMCDTVLKPFDKVSAFCEKFASKFHFSNKDKTFFFLLLYYDVIISLFLSILPYFSS